jgi:DNA-binding transcriptional regulator YiaG
MTKEELKAIRMRLGYSQNEMAAAIRLGPNGDRTIRRWEAGEIPISGPASLALELLDEKTRLTVP